MPTIIETMLQNKERVVEFKKLTERAKELNQAIDSSRRLKLEGIFNRMFKGVVSKRVIEENKPDDERAYAMTRAGFAIKGYGRNFITQDLRFLNLQLKDNKERVTKFILENCSEKKKEEIAIFLKHIQDIPQPEWQDLEITKDIQKDVIIPFRKYEKEIFVVQTITEATLTANGIISFGEVGRGLNVDSLEGYVIIEQVLEDVVDMHKQLITLMEDKKKGFDEGIAKLEEELSPYRVAKVL